MHRMTKPHGRVWPAEHSLPSLDTLERLSKPAVEQAVEPPVEQGPTWDALSAIEPKLLHFEKSAREAGSNQWRTYIAWLKHFQQFVGLFHKLPPGSVDVVLEHLGAVHREAMQEGSG